MSRDSSDTSSGDNPALNKANLEAGQQLEPAIFEEDTDTSEARPTTDSSSSNAESFHEAASEAGEAASEAGQQLEPTVFGSEEKRQSNPRQGQFILLPAGEPETKACRANRHLGILGLLMFSSIWGLLAREGLVALNSYDGQSIEATIWAQAVGCFIMGWTVSNKVALEEWYPPAYIALTTGFCGSLTTFSSWILHVFQAYGNQLHYNRHGLHNVMDALTQTSVTIGMSLISLHAGKRIAKVFPIRPILHYFERFTVHKRFNREDELLDATFLAPYTIMPDIASAVLGIAFWIASAVLCATYVPFRRVTFAVVLSPPGAILRWYLSRLNSINQSKHFPYWPLGTLSANLSATAILCAVFVGQHIGRQSGASALGAHTANTCSALYGLQEGFCGCLSTISTFVVELDTIKPKRRSFGYMFASYLFGICLCVLLIGSPWWSIGMDGSCAT